MPNPKNALQLALAKGALATRPLEEIKEEQEETIRWAEEVARNFPVKVRRGRPPKETESSAPSRSVTVRFPREQAEAVLAAAVRNGFSLSEFVRAAACQVAGKDRPVPPLPAARPKAKRSPPLKAR